MLWVGEEQLDVRVMWNVSGTDFGTSSGIAFPPGGFILPLFPNLKAG